MVKVSIGTDLVLYTDSLHVVDLGSRELVSVLNWTLSDLLIQNSHVDGLLNGFLIGCVVEVLVSLISVLISLYNGY